MDAAWKLAVTSGCRPSLGGSPSHTICATLQHLLCIPPVHAPSLQPLMPCSQIPSLATASIHRLHSAVEEAEGTESGPADMDKATAPLLDEIKALQAKAIETEAQHKDLVSYLEETVLSLQNKGRSSELATENERLTQQLAALKEDAAATAAATAAAAAVTKDAADCAEATSSAEVRPPTHQGRDVLSAQHDPCWRCHPCVSACRPLTNHLAVLFSCRW